MSNTSVHTLDSAPQVVGDWLSDLQDALKLKDKTRSYKILRTVLHTLRDWITTDEAAQLSAQLPILVRGIFYDGWNPSTGVPRPHGKKAFLERVNSSFTKEPLPDTEKAIVAVFTLLAKHVSAGELGDIRGSMAKDLQVLWDQI